MSYEQHDPKVDILVQCKNKNCPEKNKPKWFPPNLQMADGEWIICGACGNETRFIGPNRPKYGKPIDPAGINATRPLIDFEEDDTP